MLKLIVLIVLINFFYYTRCDHVTINSCPDYGECLDNVDTELINEIKGNAFVATNPCKNFWDFACGSWTPNPYHDHVDAFGALENIYADKLSFVLKNLQEEDDSMLVQKIWQYFQSCRSIGNYYMDVSQYIPEFPIKEMFGEGFKWSKVFDKNSAHWAEFNWLQTIANLRKYGLNNNFLKESVTFASNDSLRYVLELNIPRPIRKFANKYTIYDIFDEFNLSGKENIENIEKLSKSIYEFDTQILELYKKYKSSRVTSRILNLEEFLNLNSSLDWESYLVSLVGRRLANNSQISIEIFGDLQYYNELQLILMEKDNYLTFWYLLLSFCKHLNTNKPLITDRVCMLHTSVMFPLGVNYIYNQFWYNTTMEDEEILGDILKNLKTQFLLYFEENKFNLSSQHIQYLKEKLNAVQVKIGNLPQQLPVLNDFYSSANLGTNKFYSNHLEMLKFRFRHQHQLLSMNHNLTSDTLDSYYVNDDIATIRNAPYFVHNRNLLIVPELFLQLPFFHHRQDPLFHYSLVGWIVAHELSHAFDSFGLQYDSQGNINPMGQEIAKNPLYQETLQCLSSQYPETSSLNERMADVNGLQLIWDVYWNNFPEQKNLTEEITPERLFLLNFGQFFCGILPPTINHDRDDVRVRVSVGNLREFPEVFNCTIDEFDISHNTCNIWRK